MRAVGGNPIRYVAHPADRGDAVEAEALAAGLTVGYNLAAPKGTGWILSDELTV